MGLTLSYLGVLAVMWRRTGPDDDPHAMAAWLVCMGFLVAGTVLFKRWRLPHDLVVVNGGQLVAGGLILAGPALLFESPATVRPTLALALSQAWLAGVVSIAAMLLWLWLLRHGDATRASAWWFLNPVLGLFLAALVPGEPLSLIDLGGAAVVAAGIYLVQRATPPATAAGRTDSPAP
jgi:drug/metabolite transporter (DMT)-like permease